MLIIKKSDIIKLDGKLWLITSTKGRGFKKIHSCSVYTPNEDRAITQIPSSYSFTLKDIDGSRISTFGRYDRKIKKKNGYNKEPYEFWLSICDRDLTLKQFITLWVRKYGHPYHDRNTYVRSIGAMLRGIIGDHRSEDELNLAAVSGGPMYMMEGKTGKQAGLYAIEQMKMYVRHDKDIFGDPAEDEDFEMLGQPWTVEKYYGDVHGKRIKNWRPFKARFPELFPDEEIKVETKVKSKRRPATSRKTPAKKRVVKKSNGNTKASTNRRVANRK